MSRKYAPLAPKGTPGTWLSVGNMVPQRSGAYAPCSIFVQHVGAGPATPGTTQRAWAALLPSDSAIAYIGTTTKLWQYDGITTFTDRSGAVYTGADWSFAQYGNISIAVNRSDSVQTRDASGGANFANATGSPPKARIVVTQQEQVLLFDLNDGAEKPDAFAACAPGDYTDWSGASATTATRIRQRPGGITAAIPFRDYVVVFKRGSVYKLTYTGSQFKWKVELIAIGRGAWAKHSVVNCGDALVFQGPGGSWKFDGASFTTIGELTNNFGNLALGVRSAFFSPATQNCYFFADIYCFIYNFESDRWGLQERCTTTANLGATYRMFSGEPEALSALSSGSIGVNTPDVLWLVDLSSNPCIVKSTTPWGGGDGSVEAVLLGSPDRLPGTPDALTFFSRVTPLFATPFYIQISYTQPAATSLLCDFKIANAIIDSPTVTTGIASSTEQRRFDVRKAGVWGYPNIRMPSNSGYAEIDDYLMDMAPEGRL
jgi:hypothetical protein